jgi:hypothetical protein
LFSTKNQGEKLAVFSLFSKIQDDYFNTETLLSLFDTYVNSIVNYGCEVWGFHKGVNIETLHLLSISKNTIIIQQNTKVHKFITYFNGFPIKIPFFF